MANKQQVLLGGIACSPVMNSPRSTAVVAQLDLPCAHKLSEHALTHRTGAPHTGHTVTHGLHTTTASLPATTTGQPQTTGGSPCSPSSPWGLCKDSALQQQCRLLACQAKSASAWATSPLVVTLPHHHLETTNNNTTSSLRRSSLRLSSPLLCPACSGTALAVTS